MREIRFRAWNGKRMLFMGKGGYGDFELAGGEIYEPLDSETVKRDYPLMQFTGLRDKNGVDIYEHDVVRKSVQRQCIQGDRFSGVKWVKESFAVEYRDQSFYPMGLTGSEVIGNIYETPELLGGES